MFLLHLFCIVAAVSGAPSTEVPGGDASALVKEALIEATPISTTSSDGPSKDDSTVPTTPAAEEPKKALSVPSTTSEHTLDVAPPQPTATSEDSSRKDQQTKKPILGHNIRAYDYKIPEGMYKENVDSNDWIWFLRYPQYTVDFHYYCLYQVVKEDEVERIKPGETKDCLCLVELSYWIEEKRTEVLLDTYNIPFKDGTEAMTETSIVISHPKGNIHSIALAMTDGKCKRITYTVDDSFMVKISEKETDCKEVERMKLENDAWTEANIPKKKEKEDDDADMDSISDSVPSADTQDSKKSEPTVEASSPTKPEDLVSAVTAPAVADTKSMDTTSKDSTSADTTPKDTHSAKITTKDTDSADTPTKDTQSADTTTTDTNTADAIGSKDKNPGTTDDDASSPKPNIDSPSVKDSNQPTVETQVLPSSNSQNFDAVSADGLITDASNIIQKRIGSVIISNYNLPIGPFREHPFSNHWVSLDKHPSYSLNFFLYCPYELEPYENLLVRHANLEECRSVIRLFQYSIEYKKDILLDSYKIKEEYINQEVMDSIEVMEVEDNKVVVMLTMVNNKCRRKTYEVLPGGLVRAWREDIECVEDIVEAS